MQLLCTDRLLRSQNSFRCIHLKEAALKLFGVFAFVINTGAVPVASFFHPNLKGSKMARQVELLVPMFTFGIGSVTHAVSEHRWLVAVTLTFSFSDKNTILMDQDFENIHSNTGK